LAELATVKVKESIKLFGGLIGKIKNIVNLDFTIRRQFRKISKPKWNGEQIIKRILTI